jgi:putative transposase
MTNIHHHHNPGATYFFTVRLEKRGSTLLTDHIESLRYAYAKAVQEFPVTCHAMVILPDHLHAVWTEPDGGVFYTERWRRIKTRFAQAIPTAGLGEKGIWQRRFSEHAIRNRDDFQRALQHCAQNPVWHGLVAVGEAWPYSSFAKGKISDPAATQQHLISA